MVYIQNNKKIHLFLFTFFIFFPSSISFLNIEEYELDGSGSFTVTHIDNVLIYNIIGRLNTNDKYILIEASTEENDKNKIPNLSVKKALNLEEDGNDYDYTLNQGGISSKQLIIPTSYFLSQSYPGFYLYLFCYDFCENVIISINTTNAIKTDLNDDLDLYKSLKENKLYLKNEECEEFRITKANYSSYTLNKENKCISFKYDSNDLSTYINDSNIKDGEYKKIEKEDYKGIEFNIEIIHGNLKIYKSISSLNNEIDNNKDKELLYPIGRYISVFFSGYDLKRLNDSDKEYYILAECDIECEFKIGYHKVEEYFKLEINQGKKEMEGVQGIIKYLSNSHEKDNIYDDDKYIINLNKYNKTIIDLITYSGHANIILTDGTFNDYDCSYNKTYFGSSERLTFSCNNNNEMKTFLNKFHVRAGNYGAVYYLYIQEIPNDTKNRANEVFPIDITMMFSLKDKTQITIDSYRKEEKNNSYYTIFNPLNCDLRITNLNTEKIILTENQNVEIDFGKITNSISYSIENYKLTHNEEKECFFYISSFYYNRSNSSIIVPESKPFKLKMNSTINETRIVFPYATSKEMPKILLRLAFLGEYAIKYDIKLCSYPIKQNITLDTLDILISNNTVENLYNLTFNRICPLEIALSYESINSSCDKFINAIVNINIKTLANVPYLLRTEEQFFDYDINNNYQFYLAFVNLNSNGILSFNFKFGSGMAIGKLYTLSEVEENGGLNENLINIENKKGLLEMNYYEQNLVFNKKHTGKCIPFCYLIIGIKPYKSNKLKNKFFFSDFSLNLKYFSETENETNYIDIVNDEYIIGNIEIEQNKKDIYEYHFPKYSDMLILDFECQNCIIALYAQNLSTRFYYNEEGERIITKFKSIDLTSYFDDKTEYLKIIVSIQNNNNSNYIFNNNMKYKLRMTAPYHFFENIISADTSHPIYCDDNLQSNDIYNNYFCDFLISINKYQYYESIQLCASHEYTDENLTIYAKLIDSDSFYYSIVNSSYVPSWPNFTHFNYTNKEDSYMRYNLLNIKFTTESSYKLLIRVYKDEKSPIELITNFIPKSSLVPFPEYKQLININESNLILNLPKDYFYNFHFITIQGKANFSLNKEHNFSLFGEYDKIILNTNKNYENAINLSSDNYDEQDNSYTCFVRYSKLNENFPLEHISVGTGGNYIYSNTHSDKEKEFNYYIEVNNIEGDIPFNLIFWELKDGNNIKDQRDKNSTELFDIEGYLMDEEQLTDYAQSNKKSINESFRYKGYYNLLHRQVNINIEKEILQNFKEKKNLKDEPIFIVIRIAKDPKNDRVYDYIQSKITVFPPNYIEKTAPSNTYLTNHFKKGTNVIEHLYKINAFSNKVEYIIIDFSTINKNVTAEVIYISNNTSNKSNVYNHLTVNELKKQEEIGKSIIRVKNINEQILLSIKCNNIPTQNISYTFKYYSGEEYNYTFEYNPKPIFTIIDNNLIDVTINKIKYKKKEVKCNYYITVNYKQNNNEDYNLDDDNYYDISTSFKEEKPCLRLKINYNDYLLSNDKDDFTVQLNISSNERKKVLIEITAEAILEQNNNNNYEYLAYYIFSPVEKKKKDYKILIIVLSSIGAILIIIAVLFIWIFCVRKKNENLKEQVFKISYALGSNQASRVTYNMSMEEEDNNEEEDIGFEL